MEYRRLKNRRLATAVRGQLRSVVFLLVLTLGGSVLAADQVVTDFGDDGRPNQLRAKLAALQNTGGGTLTFAGGPGTIILREVLYVSTSATIDGGGNITISGNNATQIMRAYDNLTLTLNNITLTRGFSANDDGGAIRHDGTLNLNNCIFTYNEAGKGRSGGAIVSYGPLNINGGEFTFNKAANGGALFPRFAGAIVNISDCSLYDNQTTGVYSGPGTSGMGGAILVWDGATVTISDSRLRTNTAGSGGAIYNHLAASSLSLRRTSLLGNHAKAPLDNPAPPTGGGIVNSGGRVDLTDVELGVNTATHAGGFFNGPGTASLTNVTFFANTAAFGGGGMTSSGEQTQATFTNVTFSFNAGEQGSGGGLMLGGGQNAGATASLINVTFHKNRAKNDGGGLASFSVASAPANRLSLTNVVFSENTDKRGNGNCFSQRPYLHSAFNLSSDATCSFGSGRDNIVARLAPIDKYGGYTSTHRPLPGSPLIDAGTGNGAPATDQRGITRPQGAAVDVGAVEVAPSDTATPTPTPTATPVPPPPPRPNRFVNISTRVRVETGANILFGGFIVTGSQQKKIIVRAIGPSLPVEDRLANPLLELYNGNGELIAANDNWREAENAQEIIDSSVAPSNELESAILRDVQLGAYTVQIRDVADGQGVALVEVYDFGAAQDSKLANIATRGRIQTGENIMIAGLIISGSSPQKVIVRAIGPSLQEVEGKLEDPVLELYDRNGELMAANNNWRDTQEAEVATTTIPPPHDLESAIVAFLPPDLYTAQVRGAGDTTGVGIVEVYALD